MLHILLHFLVPAIFVALFFRDKWRTSYIVLIGTMLVDLDHLLATPIYDPERCSIAFHPLHSFWAIGVFLLLCFPKQTRLVGLGLMIHMALDSLDCQATNGVWYTSAVVETRVLSAQENAFLVQS
jgi:hypothetical protein